MSGARQASALGNVALMRRARCRLGTLYTKMDDETSAFQNYTEVISACAQRTRIEAAVQCYSVYPVSMEVISWLGVWYVKNQLYEKAIEYFERASEIEPGSPTAQRSVRGTCPGSHSARHRAEEVKWKLMVASCYRRMRAYPQVQLTHSATLAPC